MLPESEQVSRATPSISAIATMMAAAKAAREARYAPRPGVADPVIDNSGRRHAPHDGWTDHDGHVYAGGEYIPEDDGAAGVVTRRVLIEVAAQGAMCDLPDVTVTFGKEFDGLCYAYVAGPRYLMKLLPYLDEKIIVPVSSGLQTGKTWKFSYKRWFQILSEDSPRAICDEHGLDKQMVGYFRPRIVP